MGIFSFEGEKALGRVADALEKLVLLKEVEVRAKLPNTLFSLLSEKELKEKDGSSVSYLNDEVDVEREIRRDAYTERTGIGLREGQDIPRALPSTGGPGDTTY